MLRRPMLHRPMHATGGMPVFHREPKVWLAELQCGARLGRGWFPRASRPRPHNLQPVAWESGPDFLRVMQQNFFTEAS